MKSVSKTLGLVALAAVLWGVSSGEASAQVGGGSSVLAYGFWGTGLYNLKTWETPPFYALYPPVYYSAPVPRAYGFSPFAYPPGFVTPELEPIQAKQIINPYVPRKAVTPSSAPSSDRTTMRPKVIVNPFVTPSALAARTRVEEPAPSLD